MYGARGSRTSAPLRTLRAAASHPPAYGQGRFERGLQQALRQSRAFRSVDPRTQRSIVGDLRRIFGFIMGRPPGIAEHVWAGRLASERGYGQGAPGTKKDTFRAEQGVDRQAAVGAATGRAGDTFANLRQDVNFPQFVADLINGVFNAIVDSSIKQMEAFAEMVKSVAKSAESYAQDEISTGEARAYLKSRFPSSVNMSGGAIEISEDDNGETPDFKASFPNLKSDFDPSDEESVAGLVLEAKVELARQKQQMLATMVMLGINRIIVTDGFINAKVVFDVKAKDKVSSMDKASEKHKSTSRDAGMNKGQHQYNYDTEWRGGDSEYSSEGQSSYARSNSRVGISTLSADTANKSSSEIEAKAKLTGEVRINFRSETFPLEKLADSGGIELLSGKSQPQAIPGAAAPAARGAGAAPAPAPAPA